MQATESHNKILADLANAKAASLKGQKFKRSAWDVVRRKKTPEQRAAKLVRIAAKWNKRFDVNKVDMQKVAASLEGVSAAINSSIAVGASAAGGLSDVAGKAI